MAGIKGSYWHFPPYGDHLVRYLTERLLLGGLMAYPIRGPLGGISFRLTHPESISGFALTRYFLSFFCFFCDKMGSVGSLYVLISGL